MKTHFKPWAQFTGKYSLTLKVPGQSPRVFRDLPFPKSPFKKLTWVGFTSGANAKTAFYLDNFSLGVAE
jgi:hypothetical protein